MAGIILVGHWTGFCPARPLDAELLKTIYIVFIGAGATAFIGSIAVRRFLLGDRFRIDHKSVWPTAGLHFMRTSIICGALAESSAIMGLVYFFLGGTFSDAILLAAIGLIGVANALPRRWAYDDFISGEGRTEDDPAAQDDRRHQGDDAEWE